MKSLTLESNIRLLRLFEHIRKSNPRVILGGSLALMLHGIIPERESGDLDITSPFYFKIPYVRVRKYNQVFGLYFSDEWADVKCDLFVNPAAEYMEFPCEHLTSPNFIKIQSYKEIMEAKLEYLHKGKYKHLPDLQKYIEFMAQKHASFSDNGPTAMKEGAGGPRNIDTTLCGTSSEPEAF